MFDIVVPIYKINPEWLDDCLSSIDNQTYKNYVVWIVDGTPTDWHHYEEMVKIIAKYPEFNYFRQSGKGVSQARNEAISKGTQPYISFLDGDDYWYAGHLEEFVNLMNPDTVLCWSAMDMPITLKSPYSGETYSKNFVINLVDDFDSWHPMLHYHYLHIYPIVTSSVCIQRCRYEQVGGFDEDLGIGEDMDLWRMLLGDFRTGETYLGQQLDVITGLHRYSEVATSGDMTQSGYFDEGGSDLLKEHYDNYCIKHKIPTIEECPDFVDIKEWERLVEGYRKII